MLFVKPGLYPRVKMSAINDECRVIDAFVVTSHCLLLQHTAGDGQLDL